MIYFFIRLVTNWNRRNHTVRKSTTFKRTTMRWCLSQLPRITTPNCSILNPCKL